MGMGGVQRTTKFVKYLRDFGWEPIVLTDTPVTYYAKDTTLLEELLTKNTKIYRTPSKKERNLLNSEPSPHIPANETKRKIFSKIAKSILLPDTAVLWKNKAYRLAEEIIKKEKIDLIFSTSPPYTSLLIGKKLSKKFNLPYVVDYRDAWLDCPYNYYPTPVHKYIHKKLESSVLKSAHRIISINEPIKEIVENRYPEESKNKIEMISQGFDGEDIKEISSPQNDKFSITYCGSFFNLMTPEYFFRGLKLAFDRFPDLKNKIETVLVGIFPDKYLDIIKKLDIEKNVILKGYQNHFETIKQIIKADALWMMIGKSKWSYMISTGKLFEYIGSRKPIIACIPEGTAKEILKHYNCAFVSEPDDQDAIAERIVEVYNKYLNNILPEANGKFVDEFERKKLTGKLAGIFDNLLNQ